MTDEEKLNAELDCLFEKEKEKLINERYKRQLQMSDIGEVGQKNLSEASVLVIGLGGIGSVCVMDLVSMGIGHIGIIDNDEVSLSNLNRQIIYNENDLGKRKAICSLMHLQKLNSDIKIDAYDKKITEENIDIYVKLYDYIVCATDNIESRIIIDDACKKNKKTLINGAVEGFYGSIQVLEPNASISLRKMYDGFKDDNSTCDAIAPPCSIISAYMAQIVLMLVVKKENILGQDIMMFDFKNMSMDRIPIK